MSLPITLTLGPLASASVNWFVTAGIPVSGTALALAHTSVATARRILATHGNEGSARTLRLTGTNSDGNPIRETLAIPAGAGGTVYTTQDFLTLSEAMPLGSGWTASLQVGTNGVASTPWKLVNSQHQSTTSLSWFGEATGTIVWGIQYGYSSPNDNQNRMGGALGNYPTPMTALDLPQLTGKSGNADASLSPAPIAAWRVILNSGTGSVVVTGLEGGFTESGG